MKQSKSTKEKRNKQLSNFPKISPQSTNFSLDCQNHHQGFWVCAARRLHPLSFFLLNILGEEEAPDLNVYLPFLSLTFQEKCHYLGFQTQNFHRDQFRISESKQDERNTDYLAFDAGEKEVTGFFLTGRKIRQCQTNVRPEVTSFPLFGFLLDLHRGEKESVPLRVV